MAVADTVTVVTQVMLTQTWMTASLTPEKAAMPDPTAMAEKAVQRPLPKDWAVTAATGGVTEARAAAAVPVPPQLAPMGTMHRRPRTTS